MGGTGGAADSMSGEEGEVQLQPLQPAALDTQPRKERLEAALLKVDQERASTMGSILSITHQSTTQVFLKHSRRRGRRASSARA